MAEMKAKGSIRVERRGDHIILNVFGTHALLGVGEADDLIDMLDDAIVEATNE